MPYAGVRIYANSGPLLDTAREHQSKIIDVMRDVPGLQVYGVSGDPASARPSVSPCVATRRVLTSQSSVGQPS